MSVKKEVVQDKTNKVTKKDIQIKQKLTQIKTEIPELTIVYKN